VLVLVLLAVLLLLVTPALLLLPPPVPRPVSDRAPHPQCFNACVHSFRGDELERKETECIKTCVAKVRLPLLLLLLLLLAVVVLLLLVLLVLAAAAAAADGRAPLPQLTTFQSKVDAIVAAENQRMMEEQQEGQ